MNVNDRFKIKESGKTLILSNRNKDKDPVFTVKYEDRSKADLLLSESQIKRLVDFKSWIAL